MNETCDMTVEKVKVRRRYAVLDINACLAARDAVLKQHWCDLQAALACDIKVVLCIGETLEQREADKVGSRAGSFGFAPWLYLACFLYI